jgi:hypothetical protein
MPRNVQICDNHVDNLKKNKPCATCPVRPELESYIQNPTITRSVSLLFAGAIMLVMGALTIVGYDYTETKNNAQDGLGLAKTNRVLLDNHKEIIENMSKGFEKLSDALVDLRIVIAESYAKKGTK